MQPLRPFRPAAVHGTAWLSLLFLALFSVRGVAADAATVSYNRHIRPLVSDKCFLCHGPDRATRKADLRLDLAESALAKQAIVPGKPEESELIKRIFHSDRSKVMPPPESHKDLQPEEKERLRTWIAQGARYEAHWAYVPPVKPEVPTGTNGIDYLIRKRLRSLGWQASPEADRRTLARRLYFDLVGLPPTPEAVDAFAADSSPDAYERLVDQLLASPHYGERMAVPWLDVVRFADTVGYHSDVPRNVWPYRDYVIRAFNTNKRFDTFTREQLAGDLLPENGREQKLGSAFNRLLLSTEEGGAQPKDYEYRMLTDRVRAVGTVWLGQTLGCAACHDHKFDPVTMSDFYSLGAFFADVTEPNIGPREPGMLVPTASQEPELSQLQNDVTRSKEDFDKPRPELDAPFVEWEKQQRETLAREERWARLAPATATSPQGATLKAQANAAVLAEGKNANKDLYSLTFTNLPAALTGIRLATLPHDSLPAKGPGRAGNGNFVVTEVVLQIRNATGTKRPVKVRAARADHEQTATGEKDPGKRWPAAATIDGDSEGEEGGWAILPETGKAHYLVLELGEEFRPQAGDSLLVEIHQNHGHGNHTLGHFRVEACSDREAIAVPNPWPLPTDLVDLLNGKKDQSEAEKRQALHERFKQVTPLLAPQREALARAEKALSEFERGVARCLVTVVAKERRTVRILPRGDFLKEAAGDVVDPAFPAYLPRARRSTAEQRLTRLDLADWLVSRENPLTARVTVNRFWKQFFGVGLSRVPDDLGAQGEVPSNPELLDWLACEFMDSGWDVKNIVRLMVTSQAYRQVSTPTPQLAANDPYNRELACQNRWRLEAEWVRDVALSLAGLLNPTVGGASVRPYQPAGYWDHLNFPARTYEASEGRDQYRRGLYTWWQRSYLHPSLLAFDAPSREECIAERTRSNIPQQALVLLNDPTYVEAARGFALRILKQGGAAARDRLRWGWREALAREPQPEELGSLLQLQTWLQVEYERDPKAAEAFLGVGQMLLPSGATAPELAAWAQIARVLLNLHETITRS
jgi:hypothetical protein